MGKQAAGHTITGKPAKDEASELREKGRTARNMRERSGHPDDGTSTHPAAKETGTKGESNVGIDETSGDG